jgi:GAF domain-containing protein
MSPPLSLPLDDERLAVEAADGLLAAELLGTVFPAEGSVTGEVIRTGRAVVLADASADPRSAQPIVRAGVGPAVFVPLAVRGRTLGTLTVANRTGGGLLRDSEVQLVETFAEQAAVALEYAHPQVAAELSGRAADVVQLTRETLSYVSRHAQAATCRVSLYLEGDDGVLEVDDDGRGFDPAGPTGTGQGLRNLRERAERLGGRAEIASHPGQGTRVRVTIPGRPGP